MRPLSQDRSIADLLRPAYFVPDSKSVADLYYTFSRRKLSLALTVDEYGGVTGLVTMEDVLECIFGEIMSRSELLRQRHIKFERIADEGYRVDGSMPIAHFNRLAGTDLATEVAETVGGLLLSRFGELPPEGRRIIIDNCEFVIDSVEGQRIAGLTVRRKPDALAGTDQTRNWIKPPLVRRMHRARHRTSEAWTFW